MQERWRAKKRAKAEEERQGIRIAKKRTQKKGRGRETERGRKEEGEKQRGESSRAYVR